MNYLTPNITAQVAINRVYNFLNQSKTAEKWCVNVRFTIEKHEGYEGEVSISGFGGADEQEHEVSDPEDADHRDRASEGGRSGGTEHRPL